MSNPGSVYITMGITETNYLPLQFTRIQLEAFQGTNKPHKSVNVFSMWQNLKEKYQRILMQKDNSRNSALGVSSVSSYN